MKLAHDIALLSRQKRLPSLRALLSRKPARKLRGKELATRKQEYQTMSARIAGKLTAINDKYRKK